MSTKKQQQRIITERQAYGLMENPAYQEAFESYTTALYRKFQRYNMIPGKVAADVPTKNMFKALRLMPWENTADDWARLHATEIFYRGTK